MINVVINNAFIVMRGSEKNDKKQDFLKQLTFQLAKPYVSNRKLRGETKVLAEKLGFVDTASNIMNHTVQGIRRGGCYRCAKHTRLPCMICRQRVFAQHRKIPKNTYCLEC